MADAPPYDPVDTMDGAYSLALDGDEDIPAVTSGDLHPAAIAVRKRLWWRNAMVNSCFIASWFGFATLLSVYNKWMFSDKHFGFSWPLFVTTCHMFVQFALAAFVRAIWPRMFRPQHDPSIKDYSRKVAPTAVATSLDIGLSNLSLKAITLSFYMSNQATDVPTVLEQFAAMCKSSSLIFVLAFAFLFRLEVYSLRLVGVIFLICSGVLMMVASETQFVLGGFILVISASALGGLRWSLTQLLLKDPKLGMDNPVATVYWLAPTMGITLAIVSMFIEGWFAVFSSAFFSSFGKSLSTCFFLVAPGTVAFCMVLSEVYIIQRMGVVPMSIAGIAKEVTTISISAWLFGDDLTPLNMIGVAITVCGIGLFTYHKYRKTIEAGDGVGRPSAEVEDYAQAERNIELLARDSEGRLTPEGPGDGQYNYDGGGTADVLFAVEDEDDTDATLWNGAESDISRTTGAVEADRQWKYLNHH